MLLAFEERLTAWQQPLGPVFDKWPGYKQSVHFIITSNEIQFNAFDCATKMPLENSPAQGMLLFDLHASSVFLIRCSEDAKMRFFRRFTSSSIG